MANILDYLDWRGDLTLAQSPFNEVDNLILAELAFVDFSGIVPEPGQGESIPLHQAADFFAQSSSREELGVLVPSAILELLEKAAASQRFGQMGLHCFVDCRETDQQFAALTVETGDGGVYLSFRGTDDTLAGWKEDFEMCCMPQVPAQKRAVWYVKTAAAQYPRKKLRLGGHSKGGNLAVYAGVHCPDRIQRRILDIWSNDGPGFHSDLSALPKHQKVEARIHSILPKSSIIGMLLEHEAEYTVVDSDQLGFLQHDGFSWQVMGEHFITLRQMSRQAQEGDRELRGWLQGLSVERREMFVTALFDILSASGAETLTDLKEGRFQTVGAMRRAMKDVDKETRSALWEFLRILLKSNLRMVLEGIQEEAEKKSAAFRKKKG